jgi:chemotaxis protein MotB
MAPSLRRNNQGLVREQSGEDSGWLITLSDLTLLLLCFFVIWHVVDKRQTADRRPQTAAALAAVSPQPSAVRIKTSPPASPPASPSASPSTEQTADRRPQTTEVLAAVSPQPSAVRTREESHPLPINRWDELRDEMERYVEGIGLGKGVGVVSSQHELLVSLKDTVPFASGRADLREEVLPVLEKVAALAQNHSDLTLEVLGHTDDMPISTPEFPSNWELSAARASRVARYLVDKGVDPTQISTQGYAYFRPLLPNTSAEKRATNRRVEIRLYRPMDRQLSKALVSKAFPQDASPL